jgi:hypothetical protein
MCVEEALKDPDWLLAMHEELNNFTRNDVWVLEPPPNSKNIIDTKWVFRNKEDEHGVVVHNKARLMAKGYSQVEGLDFGDSLQLQDLKPYGYFLPTLHLMTFNYI